ncbi:uncharacterized protein CTRU02_206185 [Colletotrichum truncatum]|uniref:Uncharacterized protein n=1 Tax=Colletotrichum truncatum TaxID=5467 RepID=A0ACC3Z690_COLTU|nr:uncharacterized protein CTRU02_10397 [Colletotrichum truncatum]KAF6787134.1 hypothetical protein CTRU02_10397 [Colletotrichum truncatum]
MCKYVTHLRICNICSCEDTILISERQCMLAKKNGMFGSCDLGISSDSNSTIYHCWKCKERTRRIRRAPSMLQRVSLS